MQRAYPLVLAIATILLVGAGGDPSPHGPGPFRSFAAPASQVRHPGTCEGRQSCAAERSPCDARNELASVMDDCIDMSSVHQPRALRKRSSIAHVRPTGRDHVRADEARTAAASRMAADRGIWLMERRGIDWSRPIHLAPDGRTVLVRRTPSLAGLATPPPIVLRRPAEPTVPHGDIGPGAPVRP